MFLSGGKDGAILFFIGREHLIEYQTKRHNAIAYSKEINDGIVYGIGCCEGPMPLAI
jgi:hypothetical protein